MEYFFYDIRFPLSEMPESTMESLRDRVHEWLRSHANCAVVILDQAELVFEGFMQAPTRDKAFDAALGLATNLYHSHLGQEWAWQFAAVRNPHEHLVFLNSRVRPEYQLPGIDLAHVLEFTAAAIMRAEDTSDAQMFVVPQ